MRAAESPRALFLVNRSEFFVSHRLPIARAAEKRGYEVHVATPRGERVPEIEDAGFEWHELRLEGDRVDPVRELVTLGRVVRLLRRLKPDLLHNVALKCVLHGGTASRLCRVPAVVNSFTGLGYLFAEQSVKTAVLRGVVLRMFRFALGHPNSHTIFQNPDDRTTFIDADAVKSQRSSVILGSGVPIDLYVPRPEPEGSPVVLLASRLIWDKGVGEFARAAERLKKAGCDVRCVLAGASDPLNPNAVPEAQLEEWDEHGILEWWGYRDDMPDVFANVHIVCLPSYYREGVPRVLIEAASSARPIVTTDVPGCREIVRDGYNGRIVAPRDTEALISALRELLEAPERRREMGRAGRRLVESRFSLRRVVRETMQVYASLESSAPERHQGAANL